MHAEARAATPQHAQSHMTCHGHAMTDEVPHAQHLLTKEMPMKKPNEQPTQPREDERSET